MLALQRILLFTLTFLFGVNSGSFSSMTLFSASDGEFYCTSSEDVGCGRRCKDI
jgi:hypothetical protein